MVRALALLAALLRTDAYTHFGAQLGVSEHFSWSLPVAADDESGLGGGIAYVIEPGFCQRLLGRFREHSTSTWATVFNLGVEFVDCSSIEDAISRAFTTWAANHKLIGFKDVTAVCAAQGPPLSSCSIAEVVIDALPPATPSQELLAAFVVNYPSPGVTSWPGLGPGRRTTSGVDVSGDYTIGFSTMTFNTAQCWYLDNTFCSVVHGLGDAADSMLRTGLLLVWLLGFCLCLLGLYRVAMLTVADVKAHSGGSRTVHGRPRGWWRSSVEVAESDVEMAESDAASNVGDAADRRRNKRTGIAALNRAQRPAN